jgi:hypothetical protein
MSIQDLENKLNATLNNLTNGGMLRRPLVDPHAWVTKAKQSAEERDCLDVLKDAELIKACLLDVTLAKKVTTDLSTSFWLTRTLSNASLAYQADPERTINDVQQLIFFLEVRFSGANAMNLYPV